MPLQIRDLLGDGLVSYTGAWELQRELVQQRQQGVIDDTLLLLTHPPTITYGKTANPAHRLLMPEDYVARGITVVPTDRGGDVTYHGPGQLVGYPILHLGEGNRDLHRYVRLLEEIIITSAAVLGVPNATRAPWHAGVWVGDGYLAALGVKVSRWVTHHGFALNVTDEVLPNFATIVPCGVPDKFIATLSAEAGKPVRVVDAAAVISEQFTKRWL